MTVVAVIFLASVAAFAVGIAASPNQTFSGVPAAVTFLALLTSGAILAFGAL